MVIRKGLIIYCTVVSLLLFFLLGTGEAQNLKVTLLGTGAPPPVMNRSGMVFARVKPKLAIFSHIVLPHATAQDLIPGARKHYGGPLELGEDLDVIEVGDTVTLHRASTQLPK